MRIGTKHQFALRAFLAVVLTVACFSVPAQQRSLKVMDDADVVELEDNGGRLAIEGEMVEIARADGTTITAMRVTEILDGSPLAETGFSVGDAIIGLDSNLFKSADGLLGYIKSVKPGESIEIVFRRASDGKMYKVQVNVIMSIEKMMDIRQDMNRLAEDMYQRGRRLRDYGCISEDDWAKFTSIYFKLNMDVGVNLSPQDMQNERDFQEIMTRINDSVTANIEKDGCGKNRR